MEKRKRLWIILIVLIVIGGSTGGYAYYRNTAVTNPDDAEPEIQTTLVRQGDITISATGAGTIVAAEEIVLGFQSSGTLTELFVQVGDEVLADEVLAHIDATAAQSALVNAELQLAQAEMQTDGSATETGVSYNDISVEQALINREQAQADLDDLLNWEPDADEIALLEAELTSAEVSYNAARGQEAANGTSITVKSIDVTQAERDLSDAQAAYDTAYDSGRDWELNDPRHADALESERVRTADALLRAQEALQVAQLNYNATVSSTNSSSSTSAEKNLLSAQIALTTAQTPPTEDEIMAAETAVRQAQLSYQQALLNQEADQISLAQAQLNLTSAQQTVADTELIAPMDSTVMTIDAHVGEQVGSGTLMTLADLEQPMLEVYLDETDMGNVGVGFEVDVIFDALPDDVFMGHVVQVDPQLSVVSGVTAVRALVQLDTDSFAKPQTLPVGMNATVDVIGGRAQNALLVPVEALRELTPGEYAVFVMENGEPKLRFVEVGLMDYTYAEILSGLEAGETVTTGLVETE